MKNTISKSLTGLILTSVVALNIQAKNINKTMFNVLVPFNLKSIDIKQTKVGIGYERDTLNLDNRVEGFGVGVYTMPFNDFTFGVQVYKDSGTRSVQAIMGMGFNKQNGFNTLFELRGYNMIIGIDYSLDNGLKGNGMMGNVGISTFKKVPKHIKINLNCPFGNDYTTITNCTL